MDECCVICGESIPEGRQVCLMCEKKYGGEDDSDKPLFFCHKSPNAMNILPSSLRRAAVDTDNGTNHLSSPE